MAVSQVSQLVRELRSVLEQQDVANFADAELWKRYVHARDEAAFETLVDRHGPMVMGVCRRLLRNEQDAEDAFQATFLVLIRRASSIQSPSTLVNWLHGVARRTAMEARGIIARRRVVEAATTPRTERREDPWAELWPVMEEELARLAEHYRAAVILCDLEGKTRKEVAQQLGWAEGTVASRLARGRHMLAQRLARRGFAGALASITAAGGTASAGVSVGLLSKTVAACLSVASGEASSGVLSPTVIALTQGVLKSMSATKIKCAIAAMLMLVFGALGAGVMISNSEATEPGRAAPDAQEKGKATPDDLHAQVVEMKQQLQQMKKKLDRLEQETQPAQKETLGGDVTLASLFKYKVPFELGFSEFKEGGSLEIREVWGTRAKIEVGGQYLVRGKYKLPKGELGKLYFFATAGGDWGNASLATLDLQMADANKQEGEFTMVHGMSGDGWFHIVLSDPEKYSRMFANVYFGTGDNVWKKKP